MEGGQALLLVRRQLAVDLGKGVRVQGRSADLLHAGQGEHAPARQVAPPAGRKPITVPAVLGRLWRSISASSRSAKAVVTVGSVTPSRATTTGSRCPVTRSASCPGTDPLISLIRLACKWSPPTSTHTVPALTATAPSPLPDPPAPAGTASITPPQSACHLSSAPEESARKRP
ncbi:hypothetical protein [Streptacidiphilus sp. MAP12-16]|uniref:hypothetical protein n=1 Tax=Streptacidiphilus sp. MAP12-16 TaxID=3156300 RepID=UPI003510F914